VDIGFASSTSTRCRAQPQLDRYRGLIVLGGPMNVEDHPHRAHLRTELLAIERALHQGKPVFGICLGAQLLAHVLGAPIRRHRQPEIGWYDLAITAAGCVDPVFGVLGERSQAFQWHSYTFDLPHGAVHLARTDTWEQQAYRYGDNAYGVQFHPEVDQADPPLDGDPRLRRGAPRGGFAALRANHPHA
jgi:GMP synthase (glutamine-hydrolysing)